MADDGEVPDYEGFVYAPTAVSSSAHLASSPPDTIHSPPLDVSAFTYTPFYCEENVYFLCKKLCTDGFADPTGTDLFVVFISNEEKKVPLWHQKASKRLDGLVFWDYHVICIQSFRKREGNALNLVWDLDSNLPFPSPLTCYFIEAIRPLSSLNSMYHRLFRVVHAPVFLRCFASDRSHMKDPQGNWVSLPPTYEPIVADDGAMNNLGEYIQMHTVDVATKIEHLIDGIYSNKYGVVVTEPMFEGLFSQICRLN